MGMSTPTNTVRIPVSRILGRWIRGFWNQFDESDGEGTAEWKCKGTYEKISWRVNTKGIDNVQITTIST